jgi:hypothetical protein
MIKAIITVKEYSQADFDAECLRIATDQQQQGRFVNIEYAPMMIGAKVLYTAMIVARDRDA